MPIRHLNYTNRHNFREGDIVVRLVDPTQRPPAVSLALRLGDAALPGDAKIFFEAYRRTMRMRFSYGTVAVPGFQGGAAVLSDFPDADGVLFSVKITSTKEGEEGKLLADRDQIRLATADESNGRLPLLPTLSGNTGEQLWIVEYNAGGPQLVFSDRLGDWKTFANDPKVKSLIYPSILRSVLTQIVIVEEWVDDDDHDWRARWLTLANGFKPLSDLGEDAQKTDVVQWIEDVVAGFSRRARLITLSGVYGEGGPE